MNKTLDDLQQFDSDFFNQEDTMVFMKQLALHYATIKHANQKRDEGTPYVEHCIRVAEAASLHGSDNEAYIIGMLHDTLEDTATTYLDLVATFGEKIADVVVILTHKEEVSFSEYLVSITNHPLALRIKLYDRLDNMESLPYCGNKEKIQKYCEETANVFLPIMSKSKYADTKECQSLLHQIEKKVEELKQ